VVKSEPDSNVDIAVGELDAYGQMAWMASSERAAIDLFVTSCEGFERPNHFCFPDVSELPRVKQDLVGDCLAMTTLEFVIGNVMSRFPLYLVESTSARILRLEKLSIPIDHKSFKSDAMRRLSGHLL
jgi:hypothetical protein